MVPIASRSKAPTAHSIIPVHNGLLAVMATLALALPWASAALASALGAHPDTAAWDIAVIVAGFARMCLFAVIVRTSTRSRGRRSAVAWLARTALLVASILLAGRLAIVAGCWNYTLGYQAALDGRLRIANTHFIAHERKYLESRVTLPSGWRVDLGGAVQPLGVRMQLILAQLAMEQGDTAAAGAFLRQAQEIAIDRDPAQVNEVNALLRLWEQGSATAVVSPEWTQWNLGD